MPDIAALVTPPLLLDSTGAPANGDIYTRVTSSIEVSGGLVTPTQGHGVILFGQFKSLDGSAFHLPVTPEGVAVEIFVELREERPEGRKKHTIRRTVSVPDQSTVTWLQLIDTVPVDEGGDYIVPPWVASALEASVAAVAAAGVAGDAQTAAETAKDDAEAAAAVATAVTLNARTLDETIAALDMRKNAGIVIAQASDSTGDAANEYFELAWQESFSSIWKERPARVCRWFGSSYQAWETWQTGDAAGSTGIAPIFKDAFPVDKTVILNTSPEVGAPYTQFATHLPHWQVVGGKLKLTTGGGAVRETVRGDLNSRTGTDFTFTGVINTPIGTGWESEIMIASDTEAVARVAITIRATGSADLVKFFSATSTVLGTFPAGSFVANTDVPFELSLSGTTLTGKCGGNTLTATLSGGEVTTLGTTTRMVLRSQVVNCTFDDLLITGTTTLPPVAATEPQVDVYNGGAAGQTAEYQRANLAAMFPVRPDILFINHGHNYLVPVTIPTMLASIQGLVDDLNALYPGDPIPVAITSQNPQFGSGREEDHKAKMMAIRDYAISKGWGYIPTFEAFAVRPDGGANQMLDALHPGIGTGRRLMADVAKTWIKAKSRRP